MSIVSKWGELTRVADDNSAGLLELIERRRHDAKWYLTENQTMTDMMKMNEGLRVKKRIIKSGRAWQLKQEEKVGWWGI